MLNLPTLLLQLGVILVATRVVGWLFRKIGQPQVIGEMAAGILLGPSLLGWLAPGVSATLFPPGSLGFLNALSQIGLLLFMFLVGLALNPRILRGHVSTAVITSHLSIVAPFGLGCLLAMYLHPRLADPSASFTQFALFLGTAMSITAFPILARILAEQNLQRTHVGTIAIACAAADDVTAWCILAGVVLLVRANAGALPLWLTLLGTGAYVGLMVLVVRHVLGQLVVIYRRRGTITLDMLSLLLLMMLASAWLTEWLGIHALFGAFLIGAILPKDQDFVDALREKLESITVTLLLPLFFAFSGLRTSINLLSGAELWFWCALIVVVAIVGKFGGATIGARITGVTWREAGTIGILMNTRGLIELVVLNIGLELGVITPTVFTMMVLMALATTFMTAPLLAWIYPPKLRQEERVDSVARQASVAADRSPNLAAQ
jgi:Kef-type K+ transport system membrane component KefB